MAEQDLQSELRSDLEGYRAKLREAQATIKFLSPIVAAMEKSLGDPGQNERDNVAAMENLLDTPTTITFGKFTGKTFASVAEELLRTAGKDLHVDDLVRGAINGGYERGDGNFEKVKSSGTSSLWRNSQSENPKFVSLGSGRWDLAERHTKT